MLDQRLLDLLVCPENQARLTLADARLLAQVNQAISAGKVANRAGRQVEKPLEGALVRDDRALLYPISDGIPVLLIEEAIPLEPL